MLSGGERNRLLLASLFARPANVLVLDEPTNDLDLDSLELLESTLQEYAGTVLLVSHDRAFLDNVVTQTLAPLGEGRWKEYAGGYADWLAQRPRPAEPAERAARTPGAAPDAGPKPAKPARLGYKETRELAGLPARIEALETEQHEIVARMSRPDYHQAGADTLRADRARTQQIEAELAAAYARWEELEGRAGAAR
jgi:ATP-binding cassette subfamily F protein uup